jgi:hypothetical protein
VKPAEQSCYNEYQQILHYLDIRLLSVQIYVTLLSHLYIFVHISLPRVSDLTQAKKISTNKRYIIIGLRFRLYGRKVTSTYETKSAGDLEKMTSFLSVCDHIIIIIRYHTFAGISTRPCVLV